MVLRQFVYSVLFLGVLFGCSSPKTEGVPTNWKGTLLLKPDVKLPVVFEICLNDGDSTFALINNTERIHFTLQKTNENTYRVPLEPYNSELNFTLSANNLEGTWTNLAKGPDYVIDFRAVPSEAKQRTKRKGSRHKYQVQFGGEENAYPAILILNKNEQELSGTIKTETGDYRYLWGKQKGDSMWLACFDGAHAFLFTAVEKGDSLVNGVFYSGNHYQDTWQAKINDTVELTDPTKLTKAISDSTFRFTLIDQTGSQINQNNPRLQGKVTCIQIMGTWCPNCKDETEFLKEIRTKYPESALQIVAAAFEYEKDTANALTRIKQYSDAMKMNYPIYYGGSTNKKKVTDIFPDLDRIISYPTFIILDKKGKVIQVHTGFYGPATEEYLEFQSSTTELIDSLIIL